MTSDPTLFGIVLNFKNWRASRRWKKPLDSSKSRDLALSDFALRFGLALAVVTVASAAVIISRRNYAKSANLERNIEAFRLEFRRSIDAAQAATIKSIAKTIHDNIFSVIKPIDSSVRDLDARLARQEQQHADATAAHMAGTQILDVRLARLEERADASAIQVWMLALQGWKSTPMPRRSRIWIVVLRKWKSAPMPPPSRIWIPVL